MAKSSRVKYTKVLNSALQAMYKLIGKNAAALRLWLSIYSFADNETGRCYPRHQLLMDMSVISNRHNFYRTLEDLRKLKLVKVLSTGRGMNTYEIPKEYLLSSSKPEDAPGRGSKESAFRD